MPAKKELSLHQLCEAQARRTPDLVVPIDAAYPPDRLEFLLSDAGVQLLLTQTGLLAKLLAGGLGVDISLRNLFERSTLAGLAEIIDGLCWVANAKNSSNSSNARASGDREEIVL